MGYRGPQKTVGPPERAVRDVHAGVYKRVRTSRERRLTDIWAGPTPPFPVCQTARLRKFRLQWDCSASKRPRLFILIANPTNARFRQWEDFCQRAYRTKDLLSGVGGFRGKSVGGPIMAQSTYQSPRMNDELQRFRKTVSQFIQAEFVPQPTRWCQQHRPDSEAWRSSHGEVLAQRVPGAHRR